MARLDDVAILVFKEDASEEEYADAVVELVSEMGLLEGRDPSALRDFLLEEEGREWLKQQLASVRLVTTERVEGEEESSDNNE